MQTSALCSMNIKALTRNDKGLLVDRPVAPKPNVEYVSLDLTLIGCIMTSVGIRLRS